MFAYTTRRQLKQPLKGLELFSRKGAEALFFGIYCSQETLQKFGDLYVSKMYVGAVRLLVLYYLSEWLLAPDLWNYFFLVFCFSRKLFVFWRNPDSSDNK